MTKISIEQFGKDHWSLLGYVECCCVEAKNEVGELDIRKLRDKNRVIMGIGWKPEYGTKLKGYFPNKDKNFLLENHDDLDCLEDLEDNGLIEIWSMVNLFVSLTQKGINISAKLREHKAKGGYFSNFEYKEKEEVEKNG